MEKEIFIGKRFADLTVIKEIKSKPANCKRFLCRCSCNKLIIAKRHQLLSGFLRDCRRCRIYNEEQKILSLKL